MLIDAHTHLGEQELPPVLERLARDDLFLMPSAGTPPQAEALLAAAAGHPCLLPTCGLHPWHAGTYSVEQMRPCLERCAVIGEIGMDSVWTDVDLAVQRKAFTEQLDLAQALGRPVLLHTKGCEREIADILSGYSVRKLVHWYSCTEGLEAYLAQGCWFTVGPNPGDPAVEQVARRMPLDRLLLETDGFGAIAWATGEQVGPAGLAAFLRRMLAWVAGLRQVEPQWLERRMQQNLASYLGKNPV
ncbi:MAG: hydrolase TatD [Clostridiales bacterium]|nr:hydrolase TatD [Clostridiales bacterium]